MSNYSFKKTYYLSQQTPLIHFQYDQEGATLRATEVKPKLDAYLASKYGEETVKQWRIDPEKKKVALNYRMTIKLPDPQIADERRFITSNTHTFDIYAYQHNLVDISNLRKITINNMYFANKVSKEDENGQRLSGIDYKQKVEESYKETVYYDDRGTDCKIELTILCRIPKLMDMIQKSIGDFFVLHNFGTRQSKGFGSFKVIGDSDPLASIKNSHIPYFYFEDDGNYERKLSLASAVYAVMKSGINRRFKYNKNTHQMELVNEKAYVQGYIQRQYLNDLGKPEIGSEKHKAKAEILLLEDQKQYDQYLFVRAMLGLADHYQFRNLSRNGTINVFSLGENSFDIERFHSPVTIKIIDNYVFFLFGDAKNILEKTFYLYYGTPNGTYVEKKKAILQKEQKAKELKKTITIETPDAVDWPFFIKHFIQYFDSEKAKPDSGMIECGFPFADAAQKQLVNGCDNK